VALKGSQLPRQEREYVGDLIVDVWTLLKFKIICGRVDWIHVVYDSVKWQDIANTLMNLPAP
jgi:hypothetical protein